MPSATVDTREYVLDHVYKDPKHGPNQFVRWLGLKNAGGMRPVYREKRRDDGTSARDLAALVLVSRNISGARYNPWQDVVDLPRGRIWYWGDAKAHPSKGRDDWQGNKFLAQIWTAIGEHRWGDIPPILHFSKNEPGTVHFNGLCVLADLRDEWMQDKEKRIRNFHAELDILPVERVPVTWIERRKLGVEIAAPAAWAIYAKAGVRDRVRLHRHLVRDRDVQLPVPGSPDARALKQLHSLEPSAFEHLVVRAFKETEVGHDIVGTRLSKDGGFDFHGTFTLPPPLGYSIPLKGEVKRYVASNPVGPREVARLVARLQRGEHGVFVTTSYFTEQCQEEVFEDKHPVELISADRLVGMLQQLGAISGGELVDSWAR